MSFAEVMREQTIAQRCPPPKLRLEPQWLYFRVKNALNGALRAGSAMYSASESALPAVDGLSPVSLRPAELKGRLTASLTAQKSSFNSAITSSLWQGLGEAREVAHVAEADGGLDDLIALRRRIAHLG